MDFEKWKKISKLEFETLSSASEYKYLEEWEGCFLGE